jgi:hypothetical protein
LYDKDDKDAVYNSSLKKGGAMYDFNETLKRDPKLEDNLPSTFMAHPVHEMANSFAGRVPKDFGQDKHK